MASLASVVAQAEQLQLTATQVAALVVDLRDQLSHTGTISESDLDPLATVLQGIQNTLNAVLV